jgi:hypothetical protein
MEKHLGRPLKVGEIVHHKDGDGLNNSIDNLEVMDRRAHFDHHGIGEIGRAAIKLAGFYGENSPSAKLTEEQVLAIRATKPSRKYREALAKEFGTTVANIKTIRAGYTWKHLLKPIKHGGS